MKLRYTNRAAKQIEKALDYIAKESPDGANRVRERIQATAILLMQHPFSGHLTNRKGVRRITVSTYSYVLFYSVADDEVIVERLFHTSRNPKRAPRPL